MNAPVSERLTEDLAEKVRRTGVVVWLDKDAHYTAFADALRTGRRFPFPVYAHRGSFLELMLAMDPPEGEVASEHLLVHVPGYNQQEILETPLLELFTMPGARYQKALETLVREASVGRAAPEAVDAFLRRPDVTLTSADRWLEGEMKGAPAGIAAVLERMGPAGIVEQLFVGRIEATTVELRDLADVIERMTGMDAEWIARFKPGLFTFKPEESAGAVQGLKDLTAGWLLSVEYVRDLTREPVMPELRRVSEIVTGPLERTCLELVRTLRNKWPGAYVVAEAEVERWLDEEKRVAKAEDLGRIDTFRFEEETILAAALGALRDGQWKRALEWARTRRVEDSFWVRHDPKRRWMWDLVHQAAELGSVLAKAPRPLEGARSIGEAVERYAADAWRADRAQRLYEQSWREKGDVSLTYYSELADVTDALRRAYREWADRLARDFTALCQIGSFLPDRSLQQRSLYETVVHPLTTGGERVVVVLVDALRYEMVADFTAELRTSGVTVDLKARLAELPTVTRVGMNALAPVEIGGRLVPIMRNDDFAGFRSKEFSVDSPADRAKAMGDRSAGKAALQLELSEVSRSQPDALKKRLGKAQVVVVHSTEIDDAGEKGFGLDTFEQILGELRSAIRQLQAAGVKQIVVTADHGFLLRDKDSPAEPYGTKRDPDRRHVLATEARSEPGMVSVPLNALGYDVAEPRYLLLREDTAVWQTSKPKAPFVHGGNSLEERVIPVLVIRRERALGGDTSVYAVLVEPAEDVLGRKRITVRVQIARGQLDFVAAKTVLVGLRAVGRDDVTVSIADVVGGQRKDDRVLVSTKGDACEILFSLEGEKADPAQIEVFRVDAVDAVVPTVLDRWYPVSARRAVTSKGTSKESTPPPAPVTGGSPEPSEVPPATTWEGAIEDSGFRQVFLHLLRHGTVTEAELAKMLGSARRVRAFSVQFDKLVLRVPFGVRIEPQNGMKVYVKETR